MIFEYEQVKIQDVTNNDSRFGTNRSIEVTHRITRSILATSIRKINEYEWRNSYNEEENKRFSVLYLHEDAEVQIISGSRAENTEIWRRALMEK